MKLIELNNRQSCRDFSDKKIDENIVDECLDLAMGAPNCGNLQNYSVVSISNRSKLVEFSKINLNVSMIKNCSHCLVFCADANRNSRVFDANETQFPFTNFWGFSTSFADTNIFAFNTSLQFESRGIGSCFVGTVFMKTINIIEYLELPKYVMPVAILVAGYPHEKSLTRKRPRIPRNLTIHKNVYCDREENEILVGLNEKRRLDQKYYQKLYGLSEAPLEEIYSTVKYKPIDTNFYSENFMTAIKKQGFLGDQ